MVLYYITDRSQLPGGSEEERRRSLLDKITEAAAAGISYIQLREKDLPARELESLAREAVRRISEARSPARLLVNSRIDVALASEAHGVHLRSDDLSASEARTLWTGVAAHRRRALPPPVIGVSCHTPDEVRYAAAHGADFAVFGPVFGKGDNPGRGLAALRSAATGETPAGKVEGPGTSQKPLLALGGVTIDNAEDCVQAGAAGVAAIRMFQEQSLVPLVQRLKTFGNSSVNPSSGFAHPKI
ncbi:MAG: thiamine phosphate synthase [Candidatus Korobacteraceae bacterium]